MKISLSRSQFKILSSFCLDFAKGLALSTVIGQGFIGEIKSGLRLIFSAVWIGMACIFLYFALLCAKRARL
jgi:hypothetical protein